MPTHAPTVLVVDDDPNIIRRFQRNFMSNTTLGIAAVSSLETAHDLITDDRYVFDAVVCDLGFDAPMQSQEHNLYTGIDFLALVEKHRPKLKKYVISVFSEDQGYRNHAKKAGLHVVEWYEKLMVGATKPWESIERDLFEDELQNSPLGRRLLARSDEVGAADDLRGFILDRFKPMTRNYLTILPDSDGSLEIVKPIEVIGRLDDDTYFATAMNVGMTQSGVGEDFNDAMNDLQDLLLTHYETLQSLSTKSPSELVERLKENIDEYMRPRVPGTF